VTAGIRRDEFYCEGDLQSVSRESSTRFEIEKPNQHQGAQPLAECEWKQGASAVVKNSVV
jgi:hypothetical protein